MILGNSNLKIVKLASDYQNAMFDGVVQYNYETGKLFGASFSTGTLENPKNPFIEVFRLHQGERGEFDYDCNECPFRDGFTDDKEKGLYPKTRELCCLEVYVDEYFRDDWEDNFRDGVEMQIRNVLSDHLGKTISKLNTIRLAFYEKFCSPVQYQQELFNNSFEEDVLDVCVESALEDGFQLIDPENFISGDIDYVQSLYQHLLDEPDYCTKSDEKALAKSIVDKMMDGDLDGALNLLQ